MTNLAIAIDCTAHFTTWVKVYILCRGKFACCPVLPFAWKATNWQPFFKNKKNVTCRVNLKWYLAVVQNMETALLCIFNCVYSQSSGIRLNQHPDLYFWLDIRVTQHFGHNLWPFTKNWWIWGDFHLWSKPSQTDDVIHDTCFFPRKESKKLYLGEGRTILAMGEPGLTYHTHRTRSSRVFHAVWPLAEVTRLEGHLSQSLRP